MRILSRIFSLQMAAVLGAMLAASGCSEADDAATPPAGPGGLQGGTGVTQLPGSSTVPPGAINPAPVTPAPVPVNPTGPINPTPIVPVADAGNIPQPTANSDTWCAARAVLQARCQTCHGAEVAGAPMSLVTWADTQANSVIDGTKKVSELIKSRVHDTARPMPPVSNGPLTSEERAALDTWINAGYPNGTCSTPDVVPASGAAEFKWPAECTPDKIYKVQAHQNGQPYNVPANWEDNVSISIPVPWAGKVSGDVHALAIKPLNNNKRVVHHWILFAGTLEFITSWSPGKPAETFPPDVGVYMPTSGTFSLNMHYYNKGNSSAEKDESGAEICITTQLRPKTATTKMFGPFLLSIPPGKSEATATCTHFGTEPVTLITSSPHMHKTGIGGKFEVIRANGQVEVLDDSPFNQEDQKVTPINVVLNTGDQVRTTCIYNNPTSQTKGFGESTDDEMCFNFSRYYPMGALNCSGLLGF
jgi:mono/diheme cytochrome c family protein